MHKLSGWALAFIVLCHAVGAAAQLPICDGNGTCAYPETCNACPAECGTCDVPRQQARYVDGSCEHAGDGTADSCAAGPGQAGRFNNLQAALDALSSGDTLYVHAGDYFRAGDAFRIQGVGTAGAPIVITAADPSSPPVIHSFDPDNPGDNAGSHPALTGAEEPIAHIVVDNVHIDGLVAMHGDHVRVQNVTCTHGWGSCDGNWSCVRLEYCNDCVAHHNYVHDVEDITGKCDGSAYEPREAGFKEFDCNRTVWEQNTVVDTVRWGYDLHRSSFDTVVRFNLFQRAGTGPSIRMNRTGNQSAYGNVVIGGGGCIQLVAEDGGDGYADLVHHNTCVHVSSGIYLSPFSPASVMHNVLAHLAPGSADLVNLALPAPDDALPHVADRNAYDASSRWVTEIYDATYALSLAEWQSSTGYDASSIAAPSGPCAFVDAPADTNDDTFDVSIEAGACATLSDSGGAIGACAIAPCVGRNCEACGDAPVTPPDDPEEEGGAGGTGGTGGNDASGGSSASGGNDANASESPENGGTNSGCACDLGGTSRHPAGWLLLAAGLTLTVLRRRD